MVRRLTQSAVLPLRGESKIQGIENLSFCPDGNSGHSVSRDPETGSNRVYFTDVSGGGNRVRRNTGVSLFKEIQRQHGPN